MATRLTPARRKAEALALLESPQISALFEKVRLTAEPPAEPTPRRSSPLPAAIGIGLLCAVTWWCFGGLRAGALRASLPGGSHAANSVIGDTCLYRGDFYPSSGVHWLRQLGALKGSANGTGGTALAARGIVFAVFCNFFTAAFDSYYAPLALNLVLCWLCASLVARTTDVLFRDRAKSIFAAICFSVSIVATSCVGEVGPRLLGICFCYLWTSHLVAKDVDDSPIGWRGAIGMAAFLGLWSLVDLSSLAGLVIYAAFALKRRRPVAFVLAAACWCLLPLAQELVWRRLGLRVEANADLTQILAALELHGSRFVADPLGYLGFLTIECGNLLFDENPLTVLISLVGLGLISHKSKGLLRVCFFVPILVQLILLPTTRDRGSAVAGNTLLMFAILSHYGVEVSRRLQTKFGTEAFALPLVGLVLLQAAWGYSGLCRWDFPAHAFATGALREAQTVQPTTFARLSGAPQEIPTVLGGLISASRFCGPIEDKNRPTLFPVERVAPYRENWAGLPDLRRLLTAQALVLAILLIAAVCLIRVWRGLGTAMLFACCVGCALFCGSTTGFVPEAFASFERRITIKEDEKLVGAVRLSPEFVSRLQDAVDRGDEIELFMRLAANDASAEHPAEFQVAEWSSADGRLQVPATAFLEAVRTRAGRVEFSLTAMSAAKGVLVHSWQATPANGERSARLVHADGSQENLDRFPSFEIRVLRAQKEYAFQKLIERFEPGRSASYALVGF